ncbi:PLP-dependent aminotransferase family protein [Acetobacter sp. TBRC 12305]|uniref:PLP-dependent aminotransferase family protein n=1 Tax=Acetobacter garciniae TaxID=2817435 RepID=A0A939HQI3_9PROT|nr:PLP-dependent aminotransferase family protein [Acetobacter garciniae]MBO1326564.1 PLP-dependent aminotransferase family protein [Acetobacter garciniae]MBX0346253.1 PLP-dependent aminotransferase family protein [Acetobacter garciniae]
MRPKSPWPARLHDGAGSPAHRLAEALGADILAGRLNAGDRLPAHRDLAWRLGIGVGSVTRAYAMLERRGLTHSVRGRGTFVTVRADAASTVLDLATNMPPPMFSDRALARTLHALARRIDPALFNIYPPVAGHLEHRRVMTRWLEALGLVVQPDRLLLTSGAQQALSVALAVARPHVHYALTEEQTYPGMLGTVRQSGLPLGGVRMDGGGMLPACLKAALAGRPGQRAVVYLTPTAHNPTTATMDEARRRDIAALCRQYDALVIEDGVYVCGAEGEPPTLWSLAPERTFHVGSLSKILSPGLRIGALIPPPALAEACLPALLASSLMIAPLSYAMMAQWMQDGTAQSVRVSLQAESARRMDLAASILGPDLAVAPGRAFHAWLPMPPGQAVAVVERARALGVILPQPHVFESGRANAEGPADTQAAGMTGLRLALGSVSFAALPDALMRVRAACHAPSPEVSRDTLPIY